jgi:asparagine synthase (glutamine-hydrolysing)
MLDEAGPARRFVGADGPAELLDESTQVPKEEVFMPSGVALGHRRLSIVELSVAGHQPMPTQDQRYWITYNGEIYNHVEIRSELEGLGRTFRSGSDTEVILQAYAQWGRACLDRFNGMFAFVLVDRQARQVLVARDRFGVKPLYFWRSPEGFVAFASEIKQFTALPGWRAVLNVQRASDFLHWGMSDHTAETLFEGVYQLRGGECIEQSFAQFRHALGVQRWYQLDKRLATQEDPDAPRRLRQLLQDAVRLRLRSDVEVGSCLSGGVDSSSIVSLMHLELQQQGEPGTQRTFSARSDVPRLDEHAYASAVVQQTHAQSHHVTPTAESLQRDIESLVWHQDEPFGGTGIYMQWSVFKLAKSSGVRVMLDGQGADELLCGYDTFVGARMKGLLLRRHLGRFVWEWLQVRRVYPQKAFRVRDIVHFLLPISAARRLLVDSLRSVRAAARALGLVLLPESWVQRWRSRRQREPGASHIPRPTAQEGGDIRMSRSPSPYERAGIRDSDVAELAWAQYTWANLPMLLHWADRNSMAHSVESRLPFLDVRVAEFGMALAEGQRVRGAVTKRVLREAMRGLVPDMVLDRRDKLGFSTPEERWLLRDAPVWVEATLKAGVESSKGVLSQSVLERAKAMIAGTEPFSSELWRWLCFGLWMKAYDVRVPNVAVEK